MANLVFVHGVATRSGAEYNRAVSARGRRFRETAFAGVPLQIRDPYWGGHGADPQWALSSIPNMSGKYEHLGVAGDQEPAIDALLAAARADLPSLVASLSVEDLSELEAAGDDDALHRAERFWSAAAAYVARSPQPGWLDDVSDDDEFTTELQRQVEPLTKEEHLGLLDPVRAAARRLGGALSNIVNAPFARLGRERISPAVAIFIGDVFEYLRAAEPRAGIRLAVLTELKAAARDAKENGEPLVVAGHSMGAVILYDVLSDDAAMAALGTELGHALEIDLLLTIGSQVALFEELKLYVASDMNRSGTALPPHDRVPRPVRAKRWWNAFDRMDVLSFVAKPVFDGVEDFEVDTISGVAGAHGAYFTNMVFYQRLNARMRKDGLLG
ncbi:hypothetical protein [Sphingomonas aerolata]|uniref:hypothetical protein n=1 Tax=Sphingomonas aerolata TaxID=185951 RepID=UPI002FE12AB5